MFVAEYTPECLKEHLQEAGKVDSGSLDPFALLEYLLVHLYRAVNQP